MHWLSFTEVWPSKEDLNVRRMACAYACHNVQLVGMSAMKQWKLADSLKLITLANRDYALPLYGGSDLPVTESSTRQRTRNNGEEEGGQERGKELT